MRDATNQHPLQTEAAPGSAGRRDLRALHGKICGDLRSRQAWLSRQSAWYQMRHDGLRRKHKPLRRLAHRQCAAAGRVMFLIRSAVLALPLLRLVLEAFAFFR